MAKISGMLLNGVCPSFRRRVNPEKNINIQEY
jgi:hypothetical protein